MLALLLLPFAVLAAEPDPALREPDDVSGSQDWGKVFERSRSTYRAGVDVYSIGLGVGLLGNLLGNPIVAIAGGLAEATGQPLMAGGSLRATRAVNESGGHVSVVGGTLAWIFWGGGLVVGVVDSTDDGYRSLGGTIGQIGCEAGSVVSSAVQYSAAKRHWAGASRSTPSDEETDELPEALGPSASGPVVAGVAPLYLPHGGGVVVAIQF